MPGNGNGNGRASKFGVGFWTLAFLMFSSVINLAMFTASLWVQVGYVPRAEFTIYKDKTEQRDEKRDELLNNELKGISKQVQTFIDTQPYKQEGEDRQNKRLEQLEEKAKK